MLLKKINLNKSWQNIKNDNIVVICYHKYGTDHVYKYYRYIIGVGSFYFDRESGLSFQIFIIFIGRWTERKRYRILRKKSLTRGTAQKYTVLRGGNTRITRMADEIRVIPFCFEENFVKFWEIPSSKSSKLVVN